MKSAASKASMLGTTESRTSKKRARKTTPGEDEPDLVLSLRRLDPILQFLTRATGKPTVPLRTLQATLPGAALHRDALLGHIPELAFRGVLQIIRKDLNTSSNGAPQEKPQSLRLSWDDPTILIGFPPPESLSDSPVSESNNEVKKTIGTLHGSTKTAAKRRLTALRRSLVRNPIPRSHDSQSSLMSPAATDESRCVQTVQVDILENFDCNRVEKVSSAHKGWASMADENDGDSKELNQTLEEESNARHALDSMLKFTMASQATREEKATIQSVTCVLPRQASYAGSKSSQSPIYATLSNDAQLQIPSILMDAFGLERSDACNPVTLNRRRLYHHQAKAIDSAMQSVHTLVCTGTGSGKSICFLLPVLAAAMASQGNTPSENAETDGNARDGYVSLLIFPTKALAQDQMNKLTTLLRSNSELARRVIPGIIDGDTPHAQRAEVAKTCNVILTNPDTLHAAILPGWKQTYRPLLQRIKYVVIDEAHMYEGVFGAHVALVLSRLVRLCVVCAENEHCVDRCLPTFIACSATMAHPEHRFRLLCPIPRHAKVAVLTAEDDGSPRASKHFFVWNPPIMDVNGMSTGRVVIPKESKQDSGFKSKDIVDRRTTNSTFYEDNGVVMDNGLSGSPGVGVDSSRASISADVIVQAATDGIQFFRRHSADETALLLARAVSNHVRCIAFCKTRGLVEWVYERTISALKSDSRTEHLESRVESYRGGYTADARRLIEKRLFNNELLGVVGTSALELGVDIGGIDLTLHCGYPTSYSSLLQQAGRAGRGTRLDIPSVAIVVCFNSACEQHMWRHPNSLLSPRATTPGSMSMNAGIVQGHMLCAGKEFPLTGQVPVTVLINQYGETSVERDVLSDFDLLGSMQLYYESLQSLVSSGKLVKETLSCAEQPELTVYKTHTSVQNPWTRVSLRSIEAINYVIVDVSHPLQGGKMDSVYDQKAIMDTIPYSRVFYHAFPGAMITHRGRRYKVHSMTRPPPSASSCHRYNSSYCLAAFAKPTTARYSTRPLSTVHITIVKQMERVDLSCKPALTKLVAISTDLNAESLPTANIEDMTAGCLAGNGVVTIKRSVHGYKKLSPVTRVEMSRAEISLPPMEYDTFALWIDTDASTLAPCLSDYDAGVHALSHALLAVAPFFVPCASSDLDCDHNYFGCTRVMLYDVRAGGAGICAQLWRFLFVADGLLDAAIDLLESCPSCDADAGYQGGCPACLQSGHCIKFNEHLSRRPGIAIAKRMLKRLRETDLYTHSVGDKQKLCTTVSAMTPITEHSSVSGTSGGDETRSGTSPRRKARMKAMRAAKELNSARERQIVVGRPTWPLDEGDGVGGRQVNAD